MRSGDSYYLANYYYYFYWMNWQQREPLSPSADSRLYRNILLSCIGEVRWRDISATEKRFVSIIRHLSFVWCLVFVPIFSLFQNLNFLCNCDEIRRGSSVCKFVTTLYIYTSIYPTRNSLRWGKNFFILHHIGLWFGECCKIDNFEIYKDTNFVLLWSDRNSYCN